MSRWIFALASVAAALPVQAQEAKDFDTGHSVEVQPGPKRYFYDLDAKGCPAVAARCRRRAYVMPGDPLVAFEAQGPLTRVTYTARGGRTTEGWIETAALRPLTPPATAEESWLGDWTVNGDGWNASLKITRSATPGRVHIEGGAESGTNDPWRVDHGAVHVGLFAAEVEANGRLLSFSIGDADEPGAVRVVSPPEEGGFEEGTLPYDAPSKGADPFGNDRCRIRMRSMGSYLLVEDNGDCGAQGVTFSGAYRR